MESRYGLFVVELEEGVWLSDCLGDPGRTLVLENAKVFQGESAAELALVHARRYRPFRSAAIRPAGREGSANVKRERMTLEERLYLAWSLSRGIQLSADDVRHLVSLDDAMQTRICNAIAVDNGLSEPGAACPSLWGAGGSIRTFLTAMRQ